MSLWQPVPTQRRILVARSLAVIADAIQLGLIPIFSPGVVSPINDALDVIVAAAMVLLVGWHWAFLPAFLSELIPIFDLVPTWTAAVLIATRKGAPQALAAPKQPPQQS